MSHNISGFIGEFEHLRKSVEHLPEAVVVPLNQGFGFVPLDNELYNAVLKRTRSREPMKYLANCFKEKPLAWVETDYFGGAGGQSAITWLDGGKKKKRYQIEFGANINESLKEIGVIAEGESRRKYIDGDGKPIEMLNDEFDTLDLGRHRSNEEWAGRERY